jgi:predicted aspartyl protease
MLGYFENGNPYIDIEVYGLPQLKKEKQTIKALVDTGFNGHMQVPFETAFPLGLTLVGIQQINIADGSSANQFVCLGNVKIEEKEVLVPINIGAGCPILAGTQLFKIAAKNIKVDFVSEKIEIYDKK